MRETLHISVLPLTDNDNFRDKSTESRKALLVGSPNWVIQLVTVADLPIDYTTAVPTYELHGNTVNAYKGDYCASSRAS